MKAIILAAGYGKRLGEGLNELEQTDNAKYKKISKYIKGKSKPLVELQNKPLIQYTVENIKRTGVNGIYVVTNDIYYENFEEWRKDYKGSIPIKIVNDGTKSNDDRLGAVGDLQFLLRQENITDEALVIGGDNLFTFEFKDLLDFYNQKQTNILVAYKERDIEKIKRSSRVRFDNNNLVIFFEEKPEHPELEEWVCPPVYIYIADTIKLIRERNIPKEKKDLIGNLQAMLYKKKETEFHAFYRIDNTRVDLGLIDGFDKANEYIKNLNKK